MTSQSNSSKIIFADEVLDESIYNDYYLTMLMTDILCGRQIITRLAEFFSHICEKFVYSEKIWYYTNEDNLWERNSETYKINSHITRVLDKEISKVTIFYRNDPRTEKLHKTILKLILKLNKSYFQSQISTVCKKTLEKPNFQSTLNSKLYLLAFTNGVYDFHLNEFRAITKEDYISQILPYEYNPEAHTTQVWTFLNNILDVSIRDYVLKELSKCLNGELDNVIFHIFNGGDDKSQLIKLIVETLGQYTFKPTLLLITSNRINSPSSMRQKGGLYNKRFAYFAEPNTNEFFKTDLLKELTSSEYITTRNLYEKPFTFKLHCKFFLVCNTIPRIKGDTDIWRRIRIIDFKNNHSSTILPIKNIAFKQGFINILLSYYYKDVDIPEEVIPKII